MITIPLNTNTGIRIPAGTPPEKPERKRTETIERIGVSIQEAAKMLGISRPHFLPLVKEEKIRTVKIGRRILVSVQSLREFVDGTKAPCNSPENTAELQGKKEQKRHCNPRRPRLLSADVPVTSTPEIAWVAERKEKT